MIMRRPYTVSLPVTAASAVLALVNLAHGAAYDWTASSGTTWSGGWTGGSVPTSADDLTVFGPLNLAGALNIDVAANAAARSVNFTDPFAVTLTNAGSGADTTLTVQSGLTTGAGAVTIGSSTANQGVLVAVGSAQTWNVGLGGLILNNSYSGTSTLTKTGYGTLTLNASNVSTGSLVINAGSVVANGDAVAVLASGKSLGFGGGSFSYRSTNSNANTQTLGTININAGANTISSEAIGSGSSTLSIGSITRTAGSTLNLVTTGSGASIVSTPARAINPGIFYNGSDYAIATAVDAIRAVNYGVDTGTASVAAGGTAANLGAGASYLLLGNATAANQNGASYKFAVSGTTLTHSTFGNGYLVSSGAGATTGFTNTVSGTIRIGNNGSGDAVFRADNAIDTLIVGASVQNFNGTTSSPVTKTGAGLVRFQGSNSYGGQTNVLQGTLRSTSATGLGFGGGMGAINQGTTNRTVVSPGAILDLAPASAMTVNEVIALTDASLINSGSGTATIDNGIAAINLTNLGSGGSATSGTVVFGGAGSGAAATVTVAAGAITNFTQTSAGSGYTGNAPVSFVIDGQTTASAATATLTSISLNGANTIGGSGNLVINAVVANGTSSGGFSKTGAGALTLNGANTYTGGTTLSGGVLSLGNSNALAATASVIVNGGSLTSSVANVNLGTGAVSMSSGNINIQGSGVAGVFTLAANQMFTATGGTLSFDIGTTFDRIVGSGTGTFSLSNTTLALTGDVSVAGSYALFSGFGSGSVSGLTITGLDSGFVAALGTNGVLTVSAIPEPATFAVIAAVSIFGIAALRRRRVIAR